MFRSELVFIMKYLSLPQKLVCLTDSVLCTWMFKKNINTSDKK